MSVHNEMPSERETRIAIYSMVMARLYNYIGGLVLSEKNSLETLEEERHDEIIRDGYRVVFQEFFHNPFSMQDWKYIMLYIQLDEQGRLMAPTEYGEDLFIDVYSTFKHM